MLSVASKVEIIACETCGGAAERDLEGRTRGQRLLAQLREACEGSAVVALSGTRCLWSCKRSCSVHVRSVDRAGYVLCDLEPSEASAHALLAYAMLYAASSDGAVPYKQWPDALRGHFLCRIPPPVDPQKETA